ncbi:MAG: ABC transporter ATP-binding protein/permease [Firmicutes bacterium]|nr:ABC transporter ATP-binding protein/permease [Bacillota bacterium]
MSKRNRFFEDELIQSRFSRKMMGKALRYAVPYRRVILFIGVLMVVIGFTSLLPPMLNGILIDRVITTRAGFGSLNFWTVAIICLGAWAAVIIFEVVYSFFRMKLMGHAGFKIVEDIRKDAFGNLQKLTFDYYDTRPAGKILVRLTNNVDDLAHVFSNAILATLIDVVRVSLILVWLFVLDYRLASIIVIVVIPMGGALFFLQRSLMRRGRVMRNKVGNRTAYIAENIQGTTVTKCFNRTAGSSEVMHDVNTKANRAWYKMVRVNELFFPLSDGFFQIGLMAVYAASIFLFSRFGDASGLTLGTLISFIMYMGMFGPPLNAIALNLQQISDASSNLERIIEVVETKPDIVDDEDATELPPIEGRVQFEDVTFGYDEGVNILEDFNLDVPAGKTIALVGPTGAGKSTVVNLITRFYAIKSGRISIDGHDISTVTQSSLRRQIGVMMQDSFIFSGTILDNIRYARPEATQEECIEASKKVFAHEFITKLPNGYNTKTDEQGQGLSQGEKQLINIARLVLTEPKIVILDEATSSIDTETEGLIQNALKIILKDCTAFVIAHRLSTIRSADCILYIADRGIAEAGTHEELMGKKGRYYDLVKSAC